MDINNEKKIIIEDGEGKEHVMEILFTYHNEEREKDYVFFYDPKDPDNVIPMIYYEDGRLEDIEDDEEYDEVEEVFNAYQEDPKIQELKNN